MVGAHHNIKPYPLSPAPAGKINVTDPDSRNLKTTRGWVQGYNAEAVVGEGQIVLAAEISVESLDTANLQPMVETVLGELADSFARWAGGSATAVDCPSTSGTTVPATSSGLFRSERCRHHAASERRRAAD